jgi:hypothetical protein
MATTTPNYLWSVPTSSDLVKNGATAIETLGDSVDASLWNSGYGQAGKNKLINGDCSINQRGFTSTTTSGTYGFDRQNFTTSTLDGTATYSAQTFTPGAAPVAGYEAKNFARIVTAGQTNSGTLTRYRNTVENVRTFAGQTTTFSFWAKAATGTPKIAVELSQSFGSGGSPSANVNTYIAQVTLSTSWARYSVTVNVPSISGKTIGTTDNTSWTWCEMWLSAGSVYDSRTGSLGIQNNTFDMWGFQWEAGSYATPFQLAGGGSPQAELALCQRYYQRFGAKNGQTVGLNATYGNGFTTSTTGVNITVPFPVTMRITPTAIEYASITAYDAALTQYTPSAVAIVAGQSGLDAGNVQLTVTGATAARAAVIIQSATTGYLAFSAEL